MNTKILLVLLAMSFLFMSCEGDEYLASINQDSQMKKEILGENKMSRKVSDNYSVSFEMIRGYLRITKRNQDVISIEPLILECDTLAWIVQYKDGWQVLSGDSRLAPVLATSDKGTLDTKEQTISLQTLNGLLLYIRDVHYGTNTIKDRLWSFLETSDLYNKSKSGSHRAGGEIATRGMWVAVDSSYVYSVTTIPHIIQTKWGQGIVESNWNNYSSPDPQNCPWNGYTKTKNGVHTLTGCAAVAVGQIIFRFRKNNNRGIEIPMNGTISSDNVTPSFADSSVVAWSLMVNDTNALNHKYTALFLSFLGNQMGLIYGIYGTSLPNYNINAATNQFSNYKINSDSTDVYNYDIVKNSLENGDPICVFATQENPHNLPNMMLASHAFIIDSERIIDDQYCVRYLWDNDYEVDYFEYNQLEPWRFEMPDEYDPIENNEVYRNQIISGTKTVQFAMNWGYDGQGDNNYWTASYLIYPFTDEFGYYPGAYFEYLPYWSSRGINYSTIDRMVYNFNEQ